MTVANRLTLARIVLAVAFFGFVLHEPLWSKVVALLLFVAATLTDWLDGLIARRTGTMSAFGALFDPLADKLLVLAALIAFLQLRELQIPGWVIFLTIARELIIGSLRGLAALKGRVLAAERWGKWKMGVQTACIIAILLLLVVRTLPWRPEAAHELRALVELAPRYLSYLLLAATWGSGLWYLNQNRRLIQESWG